jgi:hypothetical protein
MAILHADSYARSLEERITDGLRLFGLELRGKSVLLKPNLVEYIPGAEVNTNPLLVGAATAAFLALGAKTVVVAEGPGDQIAQTGFESQLRDRKLSFVDLNRDDVRLVKVATPFTGLDSLRIPQSSCGPRCFHAKGQDAPVGERDAQPEENVRHNPRLCLRLAEERSPLEGNRPEHPRYQQHNASAFRDRGRHRRHGRQWTASGTARDLPRANRDVGRSGVRADFTCARLMGFDPYRISHLAQAGQFLGNGDVQRIEQPGERLPRTVRPFSLLPEFAHLIVGATS